jgi:hypothetical protein
MSKFKTQVKQVLVKVQDVVAYAQTENTQLNVVTEV